MARKEDKVRAIGHPKQGVLWLFPRNGQPSVEALAWQGASQREVKVGWWAVRQSWGKLQAGSAVAGERRSPWGGQLESLFPQLVLMPPSATVPTRRHHPRHPAAPLALRVVPWVSFHTGLPDTSAGFYF